jgi:hypoxanthine-DNA glycosylase
MKSRGFPPIAASSARLLILGSLPGRVSLERREYYAHPRNAFWRIMGELLGAGPDIEYGERSLRLADAGIALWDVCHEANRPGSLDTAICRQTVVPNDFHTFLRAHGQIGLICFNGAKAEELYRRTVLAGLPENLRVLRRQTLPSTSPANASKTHPQKLRAWSVVRDESRVG